MAKVDQIREKFPRITEVTFNKFVNGDTTPTKKYLEYMCSMWTKKLEGGHSIKSSEFLISMVKSINEVNRVISMLGSFSIDEFKQHLNVIKNVETEKHDKAEMMVKNFLNIIQEFEIK